MLHTPPLIVVSNHDQNYLNLMEELLTEEGYRVIIAIGTDKAYETVREKRPDLIILDLPLSNSDAAWTTLNMIQLDPETRHTPAIICSTHVHTMREIEDHLNAMGCEILPKPFHLEDMLNLIHKILGDQPTNSL